MGNRSNHIIHFRAHNSKENPDEIKKNDGKNGFITVKDTNSRFSNATQTMQSVVAAALILRAQHVKQEQQKKKDQMKKWDSILQDMRQARGSILQ